MLAAALAAALGVAVPAARADEPSLTLVGARQQRAGEPAFSVWLLVTNAGPAAVSFDAPAELSGLVETSAGTLPLALELESPAQAGAHVLATQGFLRLSYRGELPSYADGLVTLQLVDRSALPVHFTAVAAAPRHAEVVAWGRRATRPEKASKKALLIDRILGGLSTYEPVYFIAGGDLKPVTAKFQLSAQYRVLLAPQEPEHVPGLLDDTERFFGRIYMGYTQTSTWELSTPSAPFLDTTFRPALYYYEGAADWAKGPWQRLGLQAGLEHESNGKSGEDSRSLNVAFVRPIFTFGKEEHYHFTVAPKIYAYIEKKENGNIPDYRGYVDLLLKFGKLEGFELTAILRKGTKKAYGSAQLDLTYPVALLASRLGAFLQLQYFYGYGDTLLQYDRNAGSEVRVGVMIVPYGAFFP